MGWHAGMLISWRPVGFPPLILPLPVHPKGEGGRGDLCGGTNMRVTGS